MYLRARRRCSIEVDISSLNILTSMDEKMNRLTSLESLKEKIYTVLRNEISGNACCLLDLPNYYNPGDQLIWLGDIHIVRRLSKRVVYSSSLHFFNPKMIPEGACILLQGGGGFGDLYYKHQRFREYIIQKFTKNRIIILPSTVHFSTHENLQRSVEIFSRHPDLVICARDRHSFDVLQENFKNSRNYLIPDSAFAIDSLGCIPKRKSTEKVGPERVLFLCRRDKERSSINEASLGFIRNIEVEDWPTQKMWRLLLHMSFLIANRIILKIFNIFGLHWNKENDVYGLLKFHSGMRQIQDAIRLLSKYDLIITTRLHGHILACLLNIPNILVDNSYGKNSNFFHTWMNNGRHLTLNAYYADSVDDIKRIYENM